MTQIVIIIFAIACVSFSLSCDKNILYLPLDERFTTRNAFLNLAQLTPYCISTPPTDILPSLKVSGDLDKIHQWVDDNIASADAMILSAEMYLYGGLIASRISNDTLAEVDSRLQKLIGYSSKFPHLSIYISNVVMRIPSYDGDFEEPWYWANYGDELFTYSFYLDKYNQLHNPEDLKTSQDAVKNVPSNAVDEFEWRRQRNHQVTMTTLASLNQATPPFQYFYTTLDDSAEYGFNIRESQEIIDFIASNDTLLSSQSCPVYPGADEVHLAMLAKFSVMNSNHANAVSLAAVFRDESNIYAIPGYEGQPMITTLTQQVAAAGGVLVNATEYQWSDTILLVNNFVEDVQKESSQQVIGEGSTDVYSMFTPYVEYGLAQSTPVGFCDNYYANGGDYYFVQYMTERTRSDRLTHVTYAGWNTNGNTIGTVVANTIILRIFGEGSKNAQFNSLRVLEDMCYQGDTRSQLVGYVNQITNTEENTSNLTPDLDYYIHYMFKLLSAKYADIASTYDLPYKLDSVYFPWNRTFEIGMFLQDM